MNVELAELAAGLPFAVSFAMASGIFALREGRRRAGLNAAMHELRRPLQALALSLPPGADASESSLRLAAAAIDRLDREINRQPVSRVVGPTSARDLVEAAVGRWEPLASAVGRSVDLRWEAGTARVEADETELGQAVDNLISNALEHGDGDVVIEARMAGGRLRLSLLNAVGAPRQRQRVITRLRMCLSGRGRHGHGLKVVRRVAVDCGGSFRLRLLPDACEARLELPLRGEGR